MTVWLSDYDVARMTARVPHPYNEGDAEDFVAAGAPNRFVIERKRDGLFLGMAGLHVDEDCEFGYWLGKPFWGQGYATEATTAALGWAREGWGRRLVVSGHFADNPASGRVLEKAGFLYTGVVQPRHSKARGEDAPTRMMVWLA